MKIGIILTPDERSKSYLCKIISNGIKIDKIFFMNNNKSKEDYTQKIIEESRKCGFDLSRSVTEVLKENKLEFHEFDFLDINESKLIDCLKKSKLDYVIFTGGGILKEDVLNAGPKFIHLHPGITPKYRGSTCFYYSILNEDKCGVTAYIMERQLDMGPVIYQKEFDKPSHKFVDEVYDPHIRGETLIDIFKKKLLVKEDFQVKDQNKGETYYIIHPILKHIAILSCIKNTQN